jgi:hypothetical protein
MFVATAQQRAKGTKKHKKGEGSKEEKDACRTYLGDMFNRRCCAFSLFLSPDT